MTQNEKQLWAIQTTAAAPDGTGMLRVRTDPLTDLYDWTDEQREGLRARESRDGFKAEILGPLTREEYTGLSHGYRQTVDSPVIYQPWRMMA